MGFACFYGGIILDFKQYRYILKVAELESITKAANALFISQPSLSHYIAKVENELGAQIFNRSTNPISLTLAGQSYVKTAREVLRLNQQLQEEISDISSEKKGKIILGIPKSRVVFMLPELLKEFWRRYPGIYIETVEENSTSLKEYVNQGKVDIAILPLITPDSSLDIEVIYEEELLLVAGANVIDKTKCIENGVVDTKQLESLPFILLKKRQGLRKAVDVFFSQSGIKPNVIIETGSNETAYRMASLGMGAAIVPEMTVRMAPQEPCPNIYSITNRGLRWYVVALSRKDDCFSKAKKDLIEIGKEIFGQFNIK